MCALWQALTVCLCRIALRLCCRLIVMKKAYMVGSDPSILFALAVRLNMDSWVEPAHGYLEQSRYLGLPCTADTSTCCCACPCNMAQA